ncbi:MAG: outer membrane lipoprotein-sorting protein [Verrucomicrobiota bacterium]
MKLLTTSLIVLIATLSANALDQALVDAEWARGVMTGEGGVQWRVDVQSTGSDQRKGAFMAVGQNSKVYAEVIAPDSEKGKKYVAESDGSMFFWKPGLSRALAVPRKQRLTGDAAIGDVVSTSFVDGYKVASKEAGEVNGEPATVYTMKANSLSDTYAQIKYWVTTDGNLGKKAEFYTRTGKLLRSSVMEYNNEVGGRPYLSKMVIDDSGRVIEMNFSEITLKTYPDTLFDKDNLGG